MVRMRRDTFVLVAPFATMTLMMGVVTVEANHAKGGLPLDRQVLVPIHRPHTTTSTSCTSLMVGTEVIQYSVAAG